MLLIVHLETRGTAHHAGPQEKHQSVRGQRNERKAEATAFIGVSMGKLRAG